MRTNVLRLLIIAASLQLSCGGEPTGLRAPDELEMPAPEGLQVTSWPDAPDLGIVVSSEVVPLPNPPPPPDLVR